MKTNLIPPSLIAFRMGSNHARRNKPGARPVFGHRLIWWAVIVGLLTWLVCTRVAGSGRAGRLSATPRPDPDVAILVQRAANPGAVTAGPTASRLFGRSSE